MKNEISTDQHSRNQVYVHRVNVEKGWFDKPVSFLEAMALLMTEVAEASDAWYDDGLSPAGHAYAQMRSELADCYIRLLDDCSRFSLNLGKSAIAFQFSFTSGRRYQRSTSGKLLELFARIRGIIEAYREEGLDDERKPGLKTTQALAHFYLELEGACFDLGVDLQAEFEKKMKINEGRPYRHGGKHA